MKFFYQAKTKEGKPQSGAIEASSPDSAVQLLQTYGFYVTSLKEIKPSVFSLKRFKFFQKKISKKEIAILTRQMAVMLDSQMPVVQTLFVLASQIKNLELREKILKVAASIEEGNSLSEAFLLFPEIFDAFYISLIRSGETTGKISASLYYLGDHLEREYNLNARLKNAMIYPILVLVVLVVVVIIIGVAVVPGFTDILKDTGQEMPLITKIMLWFFTSIKTIGWILGLAAVGLAGFLVYYLRSEDGKKTYDKVSLKLPFIGKFLQKVFLSRFAENLSTLVTSGISINRSLKIIGDIIGNVVYKRIIQEAQEGVSQGEKISFIFVKYPEVVPAFVVQMIKVGEDTGKLDKTLMEIVNFYQKDVERSVETFMSLLEPILIIFLGLVVAVLAVAIFAPMYKMLGSGAM